LRKRACVAAEGPDFQTRAGNGGLPHQTAYPSYKDFGWMVFLGVEPRSVRVVLDEGHRDGEAGRAPFVIMPWHSPYN
jgi:hypothetical protein